MSEPCGICGKPDYCTRSADGSVAKCMRIESAKPAKGDAGGWIHKLNVTAMSVVAPKKKTPKRTEQDWTEFARKCFEARQASAVRTKLAASLGVGVEPLERLQVGCGWDDYRKFSYSTWPEKRPGGKVVGIIRRYEVPVSDGGGNKLTMQGSRHGLYLPLDWWVGKGPVIVCEGGSDTAALLTIGLSAIGRPNNIGGVNMLIGALRDCERPVIILGERDLKPERVGSKQCPADCDGCSWCYPGRYGARVTAERLRDALYGKLAAGKSKILWRMPPIGAKDVREWLNSEPSATAGKFLNRLSQS